MNIIDADLEENENYIQNKYGYCFYVIEDNEATIYNLYVYKEFRKKGKARNLLLHVISDINDHNIYNIKVEAIPQERSIRYSKLVDFYKSLGLNVI